MDEPNTTVTVGMPAAESRVRPLKVAPPGTKISAWRGRSAPPDSVRLIRGSRLDAATSWARRPLATVVGLDVPPRTVGSLALITQTVPSTSSDAGDQAATQRVLGAPAGQGTQLQEGGVAIHQQVDPLTHQQPTSLAVAGHVPLTAAGEHQSLRGLDLGQAFEHGGAVGLVIRGARIDARRRPPTHAGTLLPARDASARASGPPLAWGR